MKHCHLLSCKVVSLTLAALITFVAGSGWAATLEGNLTVKKNSGANSSDGNLTVNGTTLFKGSTTLGENASADKITIEGPITASNLTIEGALAIESVNGDVVTKIIDDSANDSTIPTAQAVKDYMDNW